MVIIDSVGATEGSGVNVDTATAVTDGDNEVTEVAGVTSEDTIDTEVAGEIEDAVFMENTVGIGEGTGVIVENDRNSIEDAEGSNIEVANEDTKVLEGIEEKIDEVSMGSTGVTNEGVANEDSEEDPGVTDGVAEFNEGVTNEDSDEDTGVANEGTGVIENTGVKD